MLAAKSQDRQTVRDSLRGAQPMEIAQQRSDVIVLPNRENESSRCIHDGLQSVKKLHRETGESRAAVVCPRGRMVKVAASQTGSVRSRGPGFNPRGRQARLRLPICLEI